VIKKHLIAQIKLGKLCHHLETCSLSFWVIKSFAFKWSLPSQFKCNLNDEKQGERCGRERVRHRRERGTVKVTEKVKE
jgi:hypothetical protein